MLQYVANRIVLTLPVLVGILLISFMLTHISGDPTDLILPADATEAARPGFPGEAWARPAGLGPVRQLLLARAQG